MRIETDRTCRPCARLEIAQDNSATLPRGRVLRVSARPEPRGRLPTLHFAFQLRRACSRWIPLRGTGRATAYSRSAPRPCSSVVDCCRDRLIRSATYTILTFGRYFRCLTRSALSCAHMPQCRQEASKLSTGHIACREFRSAHRAHDRISPTVIALGISRAVSSRPEIVIDRAKRALLKATVVDLAPVAG